LTLIYYDVVLTTSTVVYKQNFHPTEQGEQAVETVLHNLLPDYDRYHEVFLDPPSGAWSQFDLLHPTTDYIYRWDNIPKNPPKSVKRPDVVLQDRNPNQEVCLHIIESKGRVRSADADIATKLTNFVRHQPNKNSNFNGVKYRPAWHKRQESDDSWTPIDPDTDDPHWLSSTPINIATGFAFEITGDADRTMQMETAVTRYDVDFVLGVKMIDHEVNPVSIYGHFEEPYRSANLRRLCQYLSSNEIVTLLHDEN